jgi:hypothetical protein
MFSPLCWQSVDMPLLAAGPAVEQRESPVHVCIRNVVREEHPLGSRCAPEVGLGDESCMRHMLEFPKLLLFPNSTHDQNVALHCHLVKHCSVVHTPQVIATDLSGMARMMRFTSSLLPVCGADAKNAVPASVGHFRPAMRSRYLHNMLVDCRTRQAPQAEAGVRCEDASANETCPTWQQELTSGGPGRQSCGRPPLAVPAAWRQTAPRLQRWTAGCQA